MSNKIKNIGLVIGLILLVVLLAGVSIRHYNQYQNRVAIQNQAKAEQEAKKQTEQRQAAEAKQTRILDQYTLTRLECEKGQGFYARLTNTQRQVVQTPGSCGPAIIQ